ncbi:MAG: hypothetical protein LBU50_05845 [Cellulomonas sp.]|nr:hypothetical protein [Cellulomonas sp.]
MNHASGVLDQAPGVSPPVVDDQTTSYLRRRHWQMMSGMLITLGGVAPTVTALGAALTTGHWLWWVGLAVVMVLMTCSTVFASLNNDQTQRSTRVLELATWLLIATFGAGAVGVVLGIVEVVSLRAWWVVAVPLSAATGASLVAWLGMATVHSLSHAPSPGVDLLTRAQKEDVGRLLALSGPWWLRRTRLMLLAVAAGWVGPLPWLVVLYPWDGLTGAKVAVLLGVVVCLLLGGFSALAASRIDPSSAWAIAQTKMLVGLALVASAGALVVGGPVAMSVGGQLAASLVLSCASLACVATVVLIRQVGAASWAVWRARAGLLGEEVAQWVAEFDTLVLTPGAGLALGRVPRGLLHDRLRRLLWPVRGRALSAEAQPAGE